MKEKVCQNCGKTNSYEDIYCQSCWSQLSLCQKTSQLKIKNKRLMYYSKLSAYFSIIISLITALLIWTIGRPLGKTSLILGLYVMALGVLLFFICLCFYSIIKIIDK
ncbi:hypothetical protein SAMN05444401_2043 [Clostridium amylolyticum]|uniref:Zinc-ribbon domain-containing protein n=1 Tax=Clostridium amylolyticum TaxID=1121298 RepID=A0A1M6FRC8_9CLOT|nr:hypothetical protein [Clostridium amylolyticum]SHJ00169.1 hypothetical protein SAMN05444401_2043 [Clostridium amylolyticum]